MPYSYNSWYASPNLAIRDLVVDGVAIVPGVLDDDDVYAVFEYIARSWHERVEALVKGWCWGFSYRLTTNDNSLSCHASATAIDLNAPLHPFGVESSRNLSPSQIAEIHKIRDEVGCVVWGGDWRTADAMHWEISGTKAEVAAAAERIRNYSKDGFDMADLNDLRRIIREELDDKLDKELVTVKGENSEGKATTRTISRTQIIRETLQKLTKHT